jgi:hypothetical protein
MITDQVRSDITKMILEQGYWGVRDIIDAMSEDDFKKYFEYFFYEEDDE